MRQPITQHFIPMPATNSALDMLGLHHCRDLSENEPFDFLTFFEYAPVHEADFNNLLAELRACGEWKFVEREVDIRLVRDEASNSNST